MFYIPRGKKLQKKRKFSSELEKLNYCFFLPPRYAPAEEEQKKNRGDRWSLFIGKLPACFNCSSVVVLPPISQNNIITLLWPCKYTLSRK